MRERNADTSQSERVPSQLMSAPPSIAALPMQLERRPPLIDAASDAM
jgi:hypothetical protein